MKRTLGFSLVALGLAFLVLGCAETPKEAVTEEPAAVAAKPPEEVVVEAPAVEEAPVEEAVEEVLKGYEIGRASADVRVDGSLGDWAWAAEEILFYLDSEEQMLPGSAKLMGPSDLSATIHLAYTDEALYAIAKVEDDELSKGDAFNFRTGDAIAFYFSSDPYDWREGVNRIFVRPAMGDRETDINAKGWYEAELEKVEVATKSGYWGYNFEMAIPMKALHEFAPSSKEKGTFLLQIVVFDSDGPEDSPERTTLTINGKPSDLWSADDFERMILK